MKDFYEYSTPELVRMLGERFKEYRMRCDLTQKDYHNWFHENIIKEMAAHAFKDVLNQDVTCQQDRGLRR